MSSQSNDLVQICLPTYNGETHLAESLNTLLAQTHSNLRIIVMDNASTDKTAEIGRGFAKNDSRIEYYRSEEFVCASENWNRAFEKVNRSASDFFMWASDDDLWSEHYVEHLLPPLKRNPESVVSYSQFSKIDAKGRKFADFGYRRAYPRGGEFRRIRNLVVSGEYCSIYGITRLSALRWSPLLLDVSFGSDLWYMLQLCAAGRFQYTDETLFYKRTGGISETNDDSSAAFDAVSTWRLDRYEWDQISSLKLRPLTKLYIFNRLRVSSKLLFPSKRIPWFLMPWVVYRALRSNVRSFGIRTRIARLVNKYV
jgi:glycosyltransferase involved in cell wall biosynthesis